jgi:hypothetical protein
MVMYYPYFRGKQFELVLLRERADFIGSNPINPIIEFVRDNSSSAHRVLRNLVDSEAKFTVIINPLVGDLVGEQDTVLGFIDGVVPADYEDMSLGYIVNRDTDIRDLREMIRARDRENYAIIHYGHADGERISVETNSCDRVKTHIFIDNYTSRLYRRHFRKDGVRRVLIRDGFRIMRNEDYPPSEHFSDLHITYMDDGMDGFGDFLIVGDEYREVGGPAFAVAVHLTYLDPEEDMFVMHFVSERSGSPVDPAGKFQEALEKLVEELDRPGTLLFCSDACDEYRDLFESSHFPGLGYVKKLSMQHHLELLSDFLNRQ